MSDWIKTSVTSPEEGQLVLMWGGSYGDIRIGQIDSDLDSPPHWVDQEFFPCDTPTHWQPLPDPANE